MSLPSIDLSNPCFIAFKFGLPYSPPPPDIDKDVQRAPPLPVARMAATDGGTHATDRCTKPTPHNAVNVSIGRTLLQQVCGWRFPQPIFLRQHV